MLPVTGVKTTHDIEKSIRIVITSGMVNQERFSKGLRESLEPRLRAVRSIPHVMILMIRQKHTDLLVDTLHATPPYLQAAACSCKLYIVY